MDLPLSTRPVSPADTPHHATAAQKPVWSVRSACPPPLKRREAHDACPLPSAVDRFLTGHLPAGQPRLWREVAKYLVRHRLGEHLEWLSRRSADRLDKCRDHAELNLRGLRLTVDDLAFLATWVVRGREKVTLKIDLSNNRLGSEHMESVVQLLQDPCVVSLDLSGCGLNKTRIGIVCETMRTNSTLISLVLSSNSCAGSGEAIGWMLRRNTSLVFLELSDCNLGPDSFTHIADGLENNPSLEHLDLSLNRRHGEPGRHYRYDTVDAGIAQLALSLRFMPTALRSLDLSGLTLQDGDACLAQVVSMLKGKARIETLRLAQWNPSQTGLQQLGELLISTKTLRHLDLSHVGRGPDQSGLHEGLRQNTSLVTLKLQGWALKAPLAKALEGMLSNERCRLEQLEIGAQSNPPSRSALEPLARAMRENKSLAVFRTFNAEPKPGSTELLTQIEQRVEENWRFLQTLPGSAELAMAKIFAMRLRSTLEEGKERTEFMPTELIKETIHCSSRIDGNSTMRQLAHSFDT